MINAADMGFGTSLEMENTWGPGKTTSAKDSVYAMENAKKSTITFQRTRENIIMIREMAMGDSGRTWSQCLMGLGRKADRTPERR